MKQALNLFHLTASRMLRKAYTVLTAWWHRLEPVFAEPVEWAFFSILL